MVWHPSRTHEPEEIISVEEEHHGTCVLLTHTAILHPLMHLLNAVRVSHSLKRLWWCNWRIFPDVLIFLYLMSMRSFCRLFLLIFLTAPLPSYSILVAASTSIWQQFVDTKLNQATFRKLQIDNPLMFVALDYNPVDKKVYWSDVQANKINRMSVTGVGGVDTIVW